MTLPRPIIPGATHLVSRRCTQRLFLLKPRPLVEQAFLYVVAIAAERYQVRVHALVVMSNHWHAVVTDPEGKLPAFVHYVHEFVAKILNCELRRQENFWSSEKASIVTLEDENDVLDKLCYTILNPVTAQLVESHADWPGVCRIWQEKEASQDIERPSVFYREKGKMPKRVTFTLHRPPVWPEDSDVRTSQGLVRLLQEREEETCRLIRERGGRFLGRRAILRQRTNQKPKKRDKRFGIKPRIAAKSRWHRVEALRRLKTWYQAYREALTAWRAGQLDVVFPYGTYEMRVHAKVACDGPDSSSGILVGA